MDKKLQFMIFDWRLSILAEASLTDADAAVLSFGWLLICSVMSARLTPLFVGWCCCGLADSPCEPKRRQPEKKWTFSVDSVPSKCSNRNSSPQDLYTMFFDMRTKDDMLGWRKSLNSCAARSLGIFLKRITQNWCHHQPIIKIFVERQ